MTYVGPNGEAPYSDFFTEEDRVLGRAKVETDRVFFLDPEKYGGTYTLPPVYVAPKEMSGWMKIAMTISPDEEVCDPKSENLLRFSEINEKINKTMNSANLDPRVNESVEQCFVEKPFDKILRKNAIAGIEGTLRTHIRMKIVEEMTKAMPILAELEWSENNYDTSFLNVIMESLISDLRDVDTLGPFVIKKNNYYLLFLEQIVQSYEREVIKNLPKDENDNPDFSSLDPSIRVAYEAIKVVTDTFDIKNTQMPIEPATIYPFGEELLAPSPDSDLLNNKNYFLYCLAYQKYKEDLFSMKDPLSYTPSDSIFLSKHRRGLYGVIFAIRLVEEECKVIMREVIKEEFDKIASGFYENYNPKIKNLSNYFLTSKNAFSDNRIQSIGSYAYEQKISIGSYQSMGQPEDVVDNEFNSPWKSDQSQPFKIERYIRIYEKENLDVTTELQDLLNSRDHTLRGVVKLEDLQNFVTDNLELFGDYNISDVFGNAELSSDDNSFTGNIGLSYGIRIVMRFSDPSFPETNVTLQDLETSRKEKCYYCDISNLLGSPTNLNFSTPICSAEVEMMDIKLKDLDLFSGNGSYDPDCLVKKLTATSSFKSMFEVVVPLKVPASMSLLYINEYFIKSIGINDQWDEDVGPLQFGNRNEFKGTKALCRKFFASFYNSTSFTHEENLKVPTLEFPDFFDLVFGGFAVPKIQIGQIFPPEKEFDHEIVKQNPFDKNREECSDDVDKLI